MATGPRKIVARRNGIQYTVDSHYFRNSLSEKPLPPEKSFLSLNADNLVLTAMKKADEGSAIVLRAFEVQGSTAESSILFLGQQHSFREADLLEKDLPIGDQKTLRMQPYEIDTLKLSIH